MSKNKETETFLVIQNEDGYVKRINPVYMTSLMTNHIIDAERFPFTMYFASLAIAKKTEGVLKKLVVTYEIQDLDPDEIAALNKMKRTDLNL